MWRHLSVCLCLFTVQTVSAQSASIGYGSMQAGYYYPQSNQYSQPHPHQSVYMQQPQRQVYQQQMRIQQNHQNIYPSQIYSYPNHAGPGVNSNNLYQYSTPSAHQAIMMTSASSPEMSATIVHPDKPQTKDTKNVHTPDGIVFGRPLAGYDGQFYVPVFYPISWMLSSSSNAASYASTPTTPVGYGIQAGYNSPTAQSSQYSPVQAYYANPMQYQLESMRMPYNNGKQNQNVPFTPEEMMPSDVTPDLNGNFKRVNQNKQYGDAVHSYLDSHTGYAYPTMDNTADESSYSYVHESANSGSYESPIIKFRDPKDEYNLAIEANKQQIEAQKRFEKEVLMADFRPYSSTTDNQPIRQQNGTNIEEYNANILKNYKIEPRIDSNQQRSAKSLKTTEPPIMTSIEIYDLPGANKYLGLSTTNKNQSNNHSLPQQYSSLYSQLINHPCCSIIDTNKIKLRQLSDGYN